MSRTSALRASKRTVQPKTLIYYWNKALRVYLWTGIVCRCHTQYLGRTKVECAKPSFIYVSIIIIICSVHCKLCCCCSFYYISDSCLLRREFGPENDRGNATSARGANCKYVYIVHAKWRWSPSTGRWSAAAHWHTTAIFSTNPISAHHKTYTLWRAVYKISYDREMKYDIGEICYTLYYSLHATHYKLHATHTHIVAIAAQLVVFISFQCGPFCVWCVLASHPTMDELPIA